MECYTYRTCYDVIVVGGGHAGTEAALAASRIGCEVLLLTANPDSIGQMSCNPAVGGIGKGHLVREIDAMGGEMGRCTDAAGIQFRMLNTKKGPAVQSLRVQCDKKAYQQRMRLVCERQRGLDVKIGEVVDLRVEDGSVSGVVTAHGVIFSAKALVITTGTFLRGLIHIGGRTAAGGRLADAASGRLSDALVRAGLPLARLKTGTPPRLARRSLDFSCFEPQLGDYPIHYFSHWREGLFHVEHPACIANDLEARSDTPKHQVPCYVTHTTEKTAEIVMTNLEKSAVYSKAISGVGPRYCPSIEDKIVRFTSKPTHQVFLEPEGSNDEEIYVNGLSTSFPYEVQLELVRSLPGCSAAEIIRYAYAVEYDYADPTQLAPTLESKRIENLFLAGQINGTSGYEEAAAQGLVSGLNAALKCLGKEQLILRRDQAYIGVLIDDLVTKGASEPYRMFTSRSENRLTLRHDNADRRLAKIGYDFGLLPASNYASFLEQQRLVDDELCRLKSEHVGNVSLAQILRRPEVIYSQLPRRNPLLSSALQTQVEIAVKYEGYIARETSDNERIRRMESKVIPHGTDYSTVGNLRTEARQKLSNIKPRTIGQALRVAGVSPADVSALLIWLARKGKADSSTVNPASVSALTDGDADSPSRCRSRV